jgi:hypothetical protein
MARIPQRGGTTGRYYDVLRGIACIRHGSGAAVAQRQQGLATFVETLHDLLAQQTATSTVAARDTA